MSRKPRLPPVTTFQCESAGFKTTLNKNERLKVLERFNNYRRTGTDFLSKIQIQRILQAIGHYPTPQEVHQMAGSQTIDEPYLQKVVNEYKAFCQQADDTLLRNVFDSLSGSLSNKIQMSRLEKVLLQNFEIDISEFIDKSKFYLTFQEFKSLFS